MSLSSENLLASLDLDDILSKSEDPEIPSHRPGYLHPVWIYREACRSGALEPWQGPEFLVNEPGAWRFSEALRLSIGANAQNSIDPLAYAASAPRELPRGYILLALLLPGLLVAAGLIRQLRLWAPLLAIACFGGLAWQWWHASPPLSRPIQLTVVDAEMNVETTTKRTLSATEAGWGGAVRLPLAPEPLVRHISWRNRDAQWAGGDWALDFSTDEPQFGGSGGGSFAAVVWDAPGAPDRKVPAAMSARRLENGNIQVVVDGRTLHPGRRSYLLTPVGWFVLQPRNSPSVIELELPAPPVIPGKARLLSWQRAFTNWYERFSRQGTPVVGETAVLLRQVQEDHEDGNLSHAQYYALLGALQQASGHRGVLANQLVLFCLLGTDNADAGSSAEVLRLTLSLEGLDD